MVNLFLTDREKYYQGELYGNWYTLPVDNDDLIQELLKFKNGLYISDIEIDINLKGIVEISEYENIFCLNNFLNTLSELKEHEIKQLRALIEFNSLDKRKYYLMDINDLKCSIESTFMFEIEQFDNCNDDENLAYTYIENILGGIDSIDIDTLKKYFDYEKYGRDLSINAYVSSNEICILN